MINFLQYKQKNLSQVSPDLEPLHHKSQRRGGLYSIKEDDELEEECSMELEEAIGLIML